MDISQLPLNALRAFEASARLNSFTRAGLELRVSQTAVSHQIKTLEDLLGVSLFERLPRGVVLTDEGHALLPVLSDVFRRMSAALSRFEDGNFREVLTVGVVGTFATGWLLQRLPEFSGIHPHIDLRLKTNNNRADMLSDGLDCFIRFGDGAWHGTNAERLMPAPLSPVCSPGTAGRLRSPEDLLKQPLLRSYRMDEWAMWFQAVSLAPPRARGWMFDSSLAMVEAAVQGAGTALVPVDMFRHDLRSGRIVQPFRTCVTTGNYWLTWLKSRDENGAMQKFRTWLLDAVA
ncbi:LysR family transcriptional regulator [Roseibium marinum]|uniref:LysR family transcriptional regulator of beta-lactamase n=1 Tax=Roseibium marinum TaxID=281252 RepID=A0A2S3UX60_9HYPH|nr:LysR family transcriptional regulator [Roseibium marinum]POF32305.1 LysR family transcriptional regulator of beta-lactamase [Roseibium marinum]